MAQQEEGFVDLFRQKHGLPPPSVPDEPVIEGSKLPEDIKKYITKRYIEMQRATPEELAKIEADVQAEQRDMANAYRDIQEEIRQRRQRHDELQGKVDFLERAHKTLQNERKENVFHDGWMKLLAAVKEFDLGNAVKDIIGEEPKLSEDDKGGKDDKGDENDKGGNDTVNDVDMGDNDDWLGQF